jgi:predicted RNase H-like nuclease (RuvC/YqgF family)
VDPHENPDRSNQYTDASPTKLRDQLNENWKQLRIFARAVADRDRTINALQTSLEERDKVIKRLKGRLSFARVRIALLYALVGGIAAEGAKVLVRILLARWGWHQ